MDICTNCRHSWLIWRRQFPSGARAELTSLPCMFPTYLNSGIPTLCSVGCFPRTSTHRSLPTGTKKTERENKVNLIRGFRTEICLVTRSPPRSQGSGANVSFVIVERDTCQSRPAPLATSAVSNQIFLHGGGCRHPWPRRDVSERARR